MDANSAAALKVLAEKIKSGPDDQVIEMPDGGKLRVRRSPVPGISLTVEPVGSTVGPTTITWEPASARPELFPDDIPFIPGRMATLSHMPNGWHLQWFKASAGDLDAVGGELARGGWKETTIPSPTLPGMTIRPFVLADRQRVLVLGGDLLGLIDTPNK